MKKFSSPQELKQFLARWPGAYEAMLDAARGTGISSFLRGVTFTALGQGTVPAYESKHTGMVVWNRQAKQWMPYEEFKLAQRRSAPQIEAPMEGKKMKKKSLSSLFTEGALARLLKEEDDSMAHETGASGDSLDAQVDRYLGQYENDAKKADDSASGQVPDVAQMESLDWRDLVKGRLLNEAGEENQKDEEGPGDAAAGADAMTGLDDDKPGLDRLDVESFANDVVRLIENYDSLLEVRSTLIRRAQKFLEKNYNGDVIDAFKATMRDDHGMEAGNDSGTIDADRFPAPNADRANGSAEPGVGGGGAPA